MLSSERVSILREQNSYLLCAVNGRFGNLQLKDESERCLDLAEFVEAEVSDVIAETSGVYGRCLFDQNSRWRAVEFDLRAEACSPRRGRGRGYEQG